VQDVVVDAQALQIVGLDAEDREVEFGDEELK
jgi:hypothetical protein